MTNKEYAGFWIRLGATLIDMLVMTVIFIVPLTLIYGEEFLVGGKIIYGFWDFILRYLVPVFATVWFWRKYSATPGKMVTKLKIVDAISGEKMHLAQSVRRYFAYILAMLPLGLGIVWVGIDKKKQGWHDKLAGTVVIRETRKVSAISQTNN